MNFNHKFSCSLIILISIFYAIPILMNIEINVCLHCIIKVDPIMYQNFI